ncbi:MAG: uroporphyrinogen decarboxylase family protein [Candidatus Latescibacteria bacterium]|nr:uroporphyrinogen decarboxylase family protein [Candidatus Latescibacterota bacterium]
MTRRERIHATLNHERPDRIPTTYAARGEVDRLLMSHYGVDSIVEVNRLMGADGWAGAGVRLDFSDFQERTNGTLEGDCPYAGQDFIFHDPVTFEDAWGVVRRKGKDGKYVEWLSGPLTDAEDPDEWEFPSFDRIVEPPDLAERVQRLKDQDLWVSAGVTMPYKTAWELRGMENLLSDYLLNPSYVERLYDKIFGLNGEMLIRATRAGVDMIGIGGDIAMQDRLIMSPESWRKIDKPRLANMIGRCKEINPDLHVKIHSDGDLWEIMEDLIEVGFDVIDPIQPECMNPLEVKEKYGDRIVLHGCGSVQHTIPFGTVDEVREEVITLIEKCGYNGGLVIRASNVIPFDAPTENIVTFFETVRDYKWQ